MSVSRPLSAIFLVALIAALPARADDASTLTYALTADVDSLDPDWAYDATSLFVDRQIYEGLIDFDGPATDRYVPRLASVVPTRENGFLSADGLTYAFPLRRDVKFHDGSPVTPADVKYSLMRFMLLDRDGGPSALLLEPLTGRRSTLGPDGRPDSAVYDLADKAVSLEGGALVLRLFKPFSPFLSVLAGYAPIVSKSFVVAAGGWDGRKETWGAARNPPKETSALYARADGTGPFMLGRWDRDSKRLDLVRNSSYWRSPAPLAAVRLLTVSDPRARRQLLEDGEADVAQVDARSLSYFQDVPGTTLNANLPVLQVDAILFNQNVDPRDNPWLGSGRLDGEGIPPDFFASLAVRRGFAFAFDQEAYIRDDLHGAARRAHGPIPRGLPGWRERQTGLPHSLSDAAKSLRGALGEDGWRSGFLVPMAYPEGDISKQSACRRLQSGLSRVNPRFRVDCRGVSHSTLLDELRSRRLSAFVDRWVLDYPDAHDAVEPFLGSSGFFAARLGFADPHADALIEDAAQNPDSARRASDNEELQALAIYDVPALFTAEIPGAIVLRDSVRNWLHRPTQPYGSLYEVTKLR